MKDTTDKTKNRSRSDQGRSGNDGRRGNGGSSQNPSFLQQALKIGMSLYSNRDNLFGKAQQVISHVYGEQGLNLEEILAKISSFGRMVKGVFSGEYREISPLFLIKIGFAITYYRFGKDFIPDDGSFISIADDLLVAAWAVKALVDEIEKFEAWEGDSEESEPTEQTNKAAELLPA